MSSIDRLSANYERQVRLPWAANIAGKQRVWFAVYPPSNERRVRARLRQFETQTREAGHGWSEVDLTQLLPLWLANHEYRESIFLEPEHLSSHEELENLVVETLREACTRPEADGESVVAVTGLASLFDFVRVSTLIDRVEECIRGRLLVFFPGEFQGNIYRFMDARDGFNYMAVPITSTESFIR